MSFTITSAVGSRNQMRPSNRRETKKEEGMKTTMRIMWVQAYCPNWYVYRPFFSVSTKLTKPAV
jgi:hypothetical protein